MSARLPWSHIDVGLEDGFLLREYRKALKSRLSPPCGKVAGTFVHHTNLEDAEKDRKRLVCYDCGVACDLSAMREQRLVYLTRLGAKTPRVVVKPEVKADVKAEVKPEPAPAAALPPAMVEAAPIADGAAEAILAVAQPAPATEAKPAEPPKKKGPKPPPRIVQGEARRTRFVYAKIGPMAYLSHLDLIRALPRSFRRLDVSLYYSSGFHPKPDMTFSPALSLGVASLSEILDVKLTVDTDPAELAGALTNASPEGLVWKGGVRLLPEDRGLAKVIDGARYAVGIPRRALDAIGGEARLAEEVARVLATPEIRLVRRFDRGLAKAVDVKRFLRGLSAGDARAAAFLDDARVAGDLVPLLADVSITGDGGVKIAEIMEALFGKDETGSPTIPYHAVRAELGVWSGAEIVSLLDTQAIRALAPPPAPRAAEAPVVAEA